MNFNNSRRTNVKSTDRDTIDEESPGGISSDRTAYDRTSGNHLVTKEKHQTQTAGATRLRNSDANSWRGEENNLLRISCLPRRPALDDELTLGNPYGKDDDASLLSNDVSAAFTEEDPGGNHKLPLESRVR